MASDLNEESSERGTLPSKAYVAGSLTQFAVGMHSPLMSAYFVNMGANLAEMGILRSVGNVAPTILQPLWGAVSDRVGHNRVFVALGTFTGLATVLLFITAATPIEMIVLYAIQSILFSIQIPTWLSLIGGLIYEDRRGTELGRLAIVTNAASLIATLLSGIIALTIVVNEIHLIDLRPIFGPLGPILIPPMETWREQYYIPFVLTALFGTISSIVSLTIAERDHGHSQQRGFPPVLRLLSVPSDFRRFCFTTTFFSFAMSMAWPYFIYVQTHWLQNGLFEITLASAIMTLSTIIFTGPFGRLSDRIGRKPMIILGRFLLFLVPILYAAVWFVRLAELVYLSNIIAGVAVAASSNSSTAYIYDVAPAHERGSHIAVYNYFTGIVFLGGSLVAGFMGQALVPFMGDYTLLPVFWMLVFSGILRLIASAMYTQLKEPRQYPSTMWREIHVHLHRRRHDADHL